MTDFVKPNHRFCGLKENLMAPKFSKIYQVKIENYKHYLNEGTMCSHFLKNYYFLRERKDNYQSILGGKSKK